MCVHVSYRILYICACSISCYLILSELTLSVLMLFELTHTLSHLPSPTNLCRVTWRFPHPLLSPLTSSPALLPTSYHTSSLTYLYIPCHIPRYLVTPQAMQGHLAVPGTSFHPIVNVQHTSWKTSFNTPPVVSDTQQVQQQQHVPAPYLAPIPPLPLPLPHP